MCSVERQAAPDMTMRFPEGPAIRMDCLGGRIGSTMAIDMGAAVDGDRTGWC